MNRHKRKMYEGLLIMLVGMLALGTLLPVFTSGQGANEGYLLVYVYDNKTQNPIPGAAVFMDDNSTVWYTDREGRTVIPNVPFSKSIPITVYKEGYNTTTKIVSHSANVTYVSIGMDPHIPFYSGIKGHVYLQRVVSGHTADDAIVGFESSAGAPSTSDLIDVTPTGDPLVGEYFVRVDPGEYNLWAWAYSHHIEHSVTLYVHPGTVVNYDFHLEYLDMNASGLAGNITDAVTGAPIPGASVFAYCHPTSTLYYTITDSSGFYFFSNPAAGDYTVVAMAPGYYPNSNVGTVHWLEVTYLDIALNRSGQNTSALYGFVYGDGIPLSTGSVVTDYWVTVSTNFMGIPGLYYISNTPTGPHTVGAWAPGYYPAVTTVNVPPGTLVRQDFYLQSGNLTGKESFVVGGVFYTATTNPINGATVTLSSSSTGYSNSYSCPSTSNVFHFDVVPAGGGYHVTPVKSGYSYTGYVVDGGSLATPGSDFVVPSHSLVILKLYMEKSDENKTCLWGYVYYSTLGGTVVPTVPVKLLTPPGGPVDFTNSIGIYYFSVTPGAYSATPLTYFPGGIASYDHGTGLYGSSVWSGTIAPGECRRVDFIFKFQPNDRKMGAISGQVIDLSTGNPVDNFEVKVYSSSSGPYTMLSGSTSPGTGFFNFPGLTPTSVTWTLDGYDTTFTYTFDHLEYYFISSGTIGPSTTSTALPTSFTLQANGVTWFDIYVNRTGNEQKAVIWGYLYDSSYTMLTGRFVKITSPLPGATTTTDSSGKYSFTVTPGTYTVTPILIGAGAVIYYDYGTLSSGMAPWSNSVVSGEVRHVDFIIKDYRPPQNCSAIAGMAYLNPSGDPLPAVYVKAYPVSYPGYSFLGYTDAYGFFEFHPICGHLSEDWLFASSIPGYTFDHMDYHILGTSTVLTSSSPVINFNLPPSSIMWIEIYYNKTQPCNGTVLGKVHTLYSYSPAAGATVTIYDISDPTTPVDSMVTGADGLYTFTVPAGTYKITVSLPGYNTASDEVTIPCRESVYKPFYLTPRPIGPADPVWIRFIYKDNRTPVASLGVNILGVGKFVTNSTGWITFKLYAAGNYSLIIPGSVTGAVVVAIATDDEGEELALNPEGTIHLKPGHHYTMEVVLTTPAPAGAAPSIVETKGKYSTSTVTGAAIGGLIVGGVAGFLLRKRPGRTAYGNISMEKVHPEESTESEKLESESPEENTESETLESESPEESTYGIREAGLK